MCRAAKQDEFLFSLAGKFSCLVRTPDEFSFVCEENLIGQERKGLRVERGWVALKLEGPFPFSMTGVMASFIEPLAKAGIPIFAISTFNTDYVLVKSDDVARARKALASVGHEEANRQDNRL